MLTSIFTDKNKKPESAGLKKALESSYKLWDSIRNYVFLKHPVAAEQWAYPGKSYGWNYRIRDKKRVIIYLMPCEKYFRVSFVFGAKAAEEAMYSRISKEIKDLISSAKVYAEGRGFRIDVNDKKIIKDIKRLIDIKLSY